MTNKLAENNTVRPNVRWLENTEIPAEYLGISTVGSQRVNFGTNQIYNES